MVILFVRHGHPNYEKDCLTELGHEQAENAAVRLSSEPISEIYASSCGRAYETAMHTANKLSKSITKLDFMREIRWGAQSGAEIYKNGHPWYTAAYAASLGHSLVDESWTKNPPFAGNIVFSEVERVSCEFDKWMHTLGYERDGTGYKVTGDNTDKTVALFSHAGSSSAVLSHLLNLPFFYICGTLPPDFTSITAIRLSNEKGTYASPVIEYANDSKHIKGGKLVYQM